MKNTEITLAMIAANAPAFKAEVTMADIAQKKPVVDKASTVTLDDIAPKTSASAAADDDTMHAIIRDLPQEEPKVNYLWELYSAQERRKKEVQPQSEENKNMGFDPLSVLAGVQR